MNLKRQLLLVSVLTLILPWAGCQFIRETESALREGQQQMLSGTAQAIADSLSQFPDELLTSYDNSRGANQLYGQALRSAPLVDGYLDDWGVEDESRVALRGTDGVIRYVVGNYGRYLFLHLDVRDSSLLYTRQPVTQTGVYADEVSLISDNDFGERTVFRFRAEAPGEIVATRETGEDIFAETRIEAMWRDTPSGYQLEARIPRNLLDARLGIAVTNTSDQQDPGVRSASYSGTTPGHFVTISPLLQSVAAGYVQPGLRLIITDNRGWRRALAGNISTTTADAGESEAASGWLRLTYNLLLEPGDDVALVGPDPSGREQLSYVADALQGRPASRWFRSADTGRAVVSVAHPIWSGTVQTGAIVLQQGTDAILSLTNKALTRLINLTLISTIVVALVLLGYASWLSSRIRHLSNAAERALDEKHVRSALPSALAGDEVGDLSRSFSSVLRQLGAYNDYLQSLATKLSHELRTPLTIVRSSLENLEHEPLSGDAITYTARAKDGVERLGTILNAMSEATRTEELMENIEAETFELGAILKSTVAAYSDAWPQRQFVFEDRSAAAKILGSPELIVQMLDKLVDNAIDFSAAGDNIDISVNFESRHLMLRVENPGPPLPEAMHGQLFQSMVSVRDGEPGRHLGLGLHIARLIAEGHDGTISAGNTENGVVFEVRFPACEKEANS
jgi:two-component system sensor histidine kinase ChvG